MDDVKKKKAKPLKSGEVYRDRIKDYLEKKRKFSQVGQPK